MTSAFAECPGCHQRYAPGERVVEVNRGQTVNGAPLIQIWHAWCWFRAASPAGGRL